MLLSHWVPYVLWPLIPLYWSHKNLADYLAVCMYHPTKKPMFFSPQKATENMIYLPGISSNIAIENRGTCWNMNTLCHSWGIITSKIHQLIALISLWFLPCPYDSSHEKSRQIHQQLSKKFCVSHEIYPWNHCFSWNRSMKSPLSIWFTIIKYIKIRCLSKNPSGPSELTPSKAKVEMPMEDCQVQWGWGLGGRAGQKIMEMVREIHCVNTELVQLQACYQTENMLVETYLNSKKLGLNAINFGNKQWDL